MTILARLGARKDPRGKPITTYGYRFIYRGTLYKHFVGRTRGLDGEAEKGERPQLACTT